MKIAILLLTLWLYLGADDSKLDIMDILYLNKASTQPFKKNAYDEKRKMTSLSKISNAKELATQESGEDVQICELTTYKNYLVYRVYTKSYVVFINALDGSVLQKEAR